MAFDLWTTAELFELQADRRILAPTGFWSGVDGGGGIGGSPAVGAPAAQNGASQFPQLGAFTREFYSDKEKIYFDELPLPDKRLAPFVAPNVQGRIMGDRGRNMSSFKPAYVKPKHEIDPQKVSARLAGERFMGELTLAQRWDIAVANNLRDERDMIFRRWDWMACRALVDGAVTIAGENYPAVTVDFKRDASLGYVLAGQYTWDQNTSDPFLDIRVGRRNAFGLGRSPVSKLIFGVDAWDMFQAHPKVKDALDNRNNGNASLFNNINIGSDTPAEYVGRIAGKTGGAIDMWVYSNQYEDSDGSMKEYLDPKTVVGIGNNVQGVRAFGAIKDKRARLAPVPMFPKTWDEEDPSISYTMTQSAPLMVPGVPNNTFKIKVAA